MTSRALLLLATLAAYGALRSLPRLNMIIYMT